MPLAEAFFIAMAGVEGVLAYKHISIIKQFVVYVSATSQTILSSWRSLPLG